MQRSRGASLVCTLAAAAGLVWAPAASADQCAPSLVRASISAPVDGDEVARNVRIRVGEYTGCGEALPSVRPEYRLMSAEGPVAFDRRATPLAHGELVPRAPLPVGPLTIEARDPIGEYERGPWHPLQTVQVVDRLDDTAPAFDGIRRARAHEVTGTMFLSPCEAEEGPVVETVITFRLADDGPTPHDELLYLLDRRTDQSAPWDAFRSFRPTPVGRHRGRFSWEDEGGWDQTWHYRLRVVDASGHETIGPQDAAVTAPPRPASTPSLAPASEAPSVERPRAAPEDAPPMDPAWQWGAAFGTLLGAGLAGLKRRRSVL